MNLKDSMDVDSKEQSSTHMTQSKSFEERKKDVFDQLNSIDNSLKNNSFTDNRKEHSSYYHQQKNKQPKTKHFRGRESIFKRPEAPISRCLPPRRAPDFQVNPHKWVKYSLDDVKNEHMSEKSNQAAAFTFLKELEARREASNDTDASDSNAKKIVFKKSAMAKKSKPTEDNDKACFKSSKLVMPEYIVGQRKPKDLSKRASASGSKETHGKEMKLDHLFEESIDDGD